MKKVNADTVKKLDRLWDKKIDYLEHLFGLIQESDPKSKELKNLVFELEKVLCNYDRWMEDKHIIGEKNGKSNMR